MDAVVQAQRPVANAVSKRKHDHNPGAFLWLLPGLFVVGLFTIYPVLYALDLALHRNVLTRPGQHPFIGLRNFTDVINNPALHRSMLATIEFTIWAVVGVAVLGILISLLLNQKFAGARVLQVLILIPWAVPPVMAGILWRWMFAGNVGIINSVLYSFGFIDNYISFFGNPSSAKVTVLVAQLWKDVPLASILLLAALQTIPEEIYEAADLDGAGSWNKFWYITVPFLKPSLIVILILQTLISFVTFDLIFAMTGGGPADATTFIAWYTYNEIFTNLNLGRGAALAFVIAALTLVVAMGYFYALRDRRRLYQS
jgi:multiple sugar transport system permease protein